MSPLHRVVHLAERVLDYSFMLCVRGSFAAWGTGSRIGRGARLVGPQLVQVGSRVALGQFLWLNAKDDRGDGAPTLRIGNDCYLGRFTQINAWRSVTICNDVLIGDRVIISDADHRYSAPDLPIKRQGDAFVGPVLLHEGCWIGAGAVILPGVTIGRNSVVAANAVVTHDVPERTVVAGVPARIIKQLDQAADHAHRTD